MREAIWPPAVSRWWYARPGRRSAGRNYRERLSRFGGVCCRVAPTSSPAATVPTLPLTVDTVAFQDDLDLGVTRAVIALGLPTLAICRGMQILNVATGGTLDQDVADEEALHHNAVHDVRVTPIPAARRRGREHRRPSLSPPGDRPRRRRSGGHRGGADGIVEAVEHRHADILAVQWHPRTATPRRPPTPHCSPTWWTGQPNVRSSNDFPGPSPGRHPTGAATVYASARICVLASLNYPDISASDAELITRFTRVALTTLVQLGVRHELWDTTEPLENPSGAAEFDGLMLLGGGDIDGSCYGAAVNPKAYGVDLRADRDALAAIAAAERAGRPVFGICRGSQLLNVARGGSIIGDIADYVLHHGAPGEPEFVDEPIDIVAGTRLRVDPGNRPHHRTLGSSPGRRPGR